MFRLIAVLSLLAGALSVPQFSDVNKDCIASNTAEFPNDFLLGRWYKIYQFLINGLVSSSVCAEVDFWKPTAEELQEYQQKYNTGEFPFTIEENAVQMKEDLQWHGIYSGNSEAKFYVLDTRSSMTLNFEGYLVNVFRRITDEYVLYWRCSLRGNNRWLLARNSSVTHEELLQVIASIPEVKNMATRRYCAP